MIVVIIPIDDRDKRSLGGASELDQLHPRHEFADLAVFERGFQVAARDAGVFPCERLGPGGIAIWKRSQDSGARYWRLTNALGEAKGREQTCSIARWSIRESERRKISACSFPFNSMNCSKYSSVNLRRRTTRTNSL